MRDEKGLVLGSRSSEFSAKNVHQKIYRYVRCFCELLPLHIHVRVEKMNYNFWLRKKNLAAK